MSDVLLAIGTAKGLILARSADRTSWHMSDLHFPMNGVYAVAIDTRADTPRILASAHSEHWGPGLVHSDDLGKTFRTINTGVHYEHHALWVDPENSNHLILGTDGGLVISWDRGTTWDYASSFAVFFPSSRRAQ